MLALSPAPPRLLAFPILPDASQFVFQLQGQAGVPYIIQRSTDLVAWTAVSTNILSGSAVDITNLLNQLIPDQFLRAVWQP